MAVVFGPFSFDPISGELSRGGRPVPLQQQPARVLRYLLEHPEQLVPREDIVRHIWPDGHYVNFDQGLNYCIRQIRIALGEEADAPRFLETIPRQGYRWRGPGLRHQVDGPALSPVEGPAQGAGRRRMPLWAAAAFSAFGAVMGAMMTAPPGPPPAQPSPVVSDRAATVRSHARMAFDALHVLTHAAIEPERRAEAPRAIATLWYVVSSQMGLVFTD